MNNLTRLTRLTLRILLPTLLVLTLASCEDEDGQCTFGSCKCIVESMCTD